MSTYKNKRLRISVLEFIIAVIALVTAIAGMYFQKEYVKTKGLFNIKDTAVDYIITAPTREQVMEIKEHKGIEFVTPYVYRSVKIKNQGKTYESSLYIVEDAEETKCTTFSDKLRVSGTIPNSDNSICISEEVAKNTGAAVGDRLTVVVQNTELEFIVSGVYKSDFRTVGGMLLSENNGDLAKLIGTEYKYNGAYVGSIDTSATDAYIENYIPVGDLRTREEFDSDEAYQIYLKDRETSDYSKMIFYTENYLKDVEKRNEGKIQRYLLISIVLYAVGVVIAVVCAGIKTHSYVQKDLLRDIRNNYTINQELGMFRKYYHVLLLMVLVAEVAGIIIGCLVWFVMPEVLVNGVLLVAICVLLLFSSILAQKRIINNYASIK